MPSTQKEKKARFTKNCKGYNVLREGLEDGSIDINLRPKDVHESNPEFLKYPLPSFRSALNRIKAELGVHVHDKGKHQ
jgi:hypothetical protein